MSRFRTRVWEGDEYIVELKRLIVGIQQSGNPGNTHEMGGVISPDDCSKHLSHCISSNVESEKWMGQTARKLKLVNGSHSPVTPLQFTFTSHRLLVSPEYLPRKYYDSNVRRVDPSKRREGF